MSFLPMADCAKKASSLLPALSVPFCPPQGSNGWRVEVGFSFLPVLRKSGWINGWPGSFQLHANSLMAGIPSRAATLREEGRKAVKFSGVFTQRGNPPAVRCASIAANTEAGES